MKEIWIAIATDIDDGGIVVNGIFDNKYSAKECIDDDFLAAKSLIYRVNLSEIKSTYIPFEDV